VLTYLRIRDFAIIDEIELEFGSGLTALTGETGAGKSIVVDALALAAGGRASSDAIRHGAERAEISATFDLRSHPKLGRWLDAQAIEGEGECILRRVLSRDGRSRSFINGQPVPLQTLRDLGELLVDIHGQQEFLALVRRPAQRSLVDAHGRHEGLVDEVNAAFDRWQQQRARLAELEAAGRDRDARLELLRYQVRELEALSLAAEELPELLAEQRRHANSGRLAAGVQQALELIDEADSANANFAVSRAQTALRGLLALDLHLEPAERLLADAAISIGEATRTLRHYLDALNVDPQRHEWVERRVATVEELARKHRLPAEELPVQLERLNAELRALETHASTLEAAARDTAQARTEYDRTAQALSAARRKAGGKLTREVTQLMQRLGMEGGRFDAVLSTSSGEPQAHGIDEVEFTVSANPGQPLKAVARVASGGELSRISLAVQVAAVGKALTPCLVFDEVDAGVGGAVAEIVGRQLSLLAERTQVLCVTHLAQVASQADHHVRVVKLTDGRSARTALNELRGPERIEELARMLGGVEVTQKARDHARDMLKRATRAQS